jgi:uncharacterized protein YbjT (DUF2867 family)
MHIAVAGGTGLIGRSLTDAVSAAGHTATPLARSLGTDLTAVRPSDELLAGVDVLVDVTNSPTVDAAATDWFQTIAGELGAAAARQRIRRTLVLSIVGVDRPQGPSNDAYFAAKLAHEQAHRRCSPALTVLRATQFHEFAEMALGWARAGDVARVEDLRCQPVAAEAVVATLLALATSSKAPPLVELAGPRREQLADLARRVAERRHDPVRVEAIAPSDEVTGGSMLPGPGVRIAGPSFDDWLRARGNGSS